ncbi:MAG: hypothetical protein WAN22_09375, partial [Solirubrobacteraceae bacterium]
MLLVDDAANRHTHDQHRDIVAGLSAWAAKRGVPELGQKILSAMGGERSEQACKGVLVIDARV